MSLWGDYLKDLLDVSFSGVSLQSVAGGQVVDHNFDNMPEIRSSQNAISSAHRSITSGRHFVTKRASVSIAVLGDDMHKLQSILARFRQLTQYKNKSIVLTMGVPVLGATGYSNSTTTVTFRQANLVDADMNHNATHGTVITIEFLIDDPVGVGGTAQTLLTNTGVTSAEIPLDLASLKIQGTFQEQYPVYKIKFNSVTNGDSPSVEIENGLNIITIEQAFTAGDELIIDTDSLDVRVNGEMIDFSGSFPFIADVGSMVYIRNTFSAWNIDIEVKNNPRYI